ncbi:MAG: ABC transporter ATP-binding protein [Bacteriovoracaceae bacterium]
MKQLREVIKFLFPFIRQYKMQVLGSLLLMVPLAAIKWYEAAIVKEVFDKGLGANADFQTSLRIAGILFVLALINYPARFFHFYLIRFVVDKSACLLRDKIYLKLQTLPMSFFIKKKQGDLLSQITNDTQLLAQGLRNVVDLIREPLTAIFLLGLAVYRDWQLTLVIFAVAPFFILIFQKSGKKVRKYQENVQHELGAMTHSAGEGISGQKIIKAFNLQNYMAQRFEHLQERYFSSLMRTTFVEENAHPLVELVGSVAFCFVILFAHHRISSGAITTGDFISFVTALALFMDPIRKFSQANVKLNQSLAAQNRIAELLDTSSEVDLGSTEIKSFEHEITFENVSFNFQEVPILQNVNLTIKKGEKVALIGLSGAGKSTLIHLLLRLYPVKSGRILVDGVNIEDIQLTNLRNLFGYVGQEIFLFNDSIYENLTVGRKYTEAEIKEALRVSECEEFVSKMQDKLETKIGDRGTRLSGGQGQRITLARAFLRAPPILLFDEATSALDNESEKKVQVAIENIGQNKTIVAVAHRLTTIQNYDKIVVMHSGKIIEIGKHAQLMQSGGEYAKLYQIGQIEH